MNLKSAMTLDLGAIAERLGSALRVTVHKKLKRRGLVVAISGGIDSACVAALAVRYLGPQRVFGLLLPETDSSAESTQLGTRACREAGDPLRRHRYLADPRGRRLLPRAR